MAELEMSDSGGHKKKNRVARKSLRVDLTPMVDLAFLLITFFMLTTTLLEQRAIDMKQPMKGPQQPVSECQLLNILTDSMGGIYYWEGLDCKAVNRAALTGPHTLKDKIKERKEYLRSNCLYSSGKPKELICLIKLLPGAQYQSMVKVLDEVATDSVATYAIQDYSPDEVKAVDAAQQMASR